ncbi:aldehyde dehydrogenase family protein [Pseudonocardia sp.]|uniref:aldehyde dehydrogenase family protein n=1 Tax=Pseudonocardia sp. TaxID=60912 RepID=UPI003D0C7094
MTQALRIDRTARTVEGAKMFIGGEWVDASDGRVLETLDPATGRTIGSVPRGGKDDVDRAVAAAKAAARAWQFADVLTRVQLLKDLAGLVVEAADELAYLEALDSGHYLGKAKQLVGAVPLWLDYHAGLATHVGGRTIPVPGNKISMTVLEPLGVTAHIVPWNYPLLVLVRSVAPALALGNTVVAKPAEQTPLTALKFAELVERAGFPPGVFNVVTGFGPEAGAPLASHPDVEGITFTGSVETGKHVAKLAADHIGKVNLELGGKSPIVVFPDARIDDAVEGTMQGFVSHAGQVCVAGTRLFLHQDVHDEFLGRLADRLGKVRIGDTFDDATQLGPLVSAEQLERVLRYIEIGKQEATLAFGGGRPAGTESGFFVEPTVFTGVHNRMRIAQEEIFGPVLSVIPWNDDDDLVEQANDSIFGLFAVLWTQDVNRALGTARKLQAGGVMINDWFGELPMTPHGGHKQSGVNREEGLETVHSYTQVKHICVNLDDSLVGGPGQPADWADAPL